MQVGIQFAAIKIYEDLIIDGHHRYIASVISKTKISQIYTLKPTMIHVYPWEEIEFVDEDWDPPKTETDLGVRILVRKIFKRKKKGKKKREETGDGKGGDLERGAGGGGGGGKLGGLKEGGGGGGGGGEGRKKGGGRGGGGLGQNETYISRSLNSS
ncbi:MAG: hypothetical protein IPN26_10380 [Bacteroidetes bacterium]|nr:hypothetical protein [Bacteroidota bacterium]